MCRALTSPNNGQLSSTATTCGTTLTFSCNLCYRLVGSALLTCESSGNWNGMEPTCSCELLGPDILYYTHIMSFCFIVVVYCPSLPIPVGGRISSTSNQCGVTASFTCDSCYRLSGLFSRTCQSNGSWSGSQPMCNRE